MRANDKRRRLRKDKPRKFYRGAKKMRKDKARPTPIRVKWTGDGWAAVEHRLLFQARKLVEENETLRGANATLRHQMHQLRQATRALAEAFKAPASLMQSIERLLPEEP